MEFGRKLSRGIQGEASLNLADDTPVCHAGFVELFVFRGPMTTAAWLLQAGEGIDPAVPVAEGNLGAIWASRGVADSLAPLPADAAIEWLRASPENLDSITMVRR